MEEEFMKLESEELWNKHFEMLLEKSRTHSSEVGDTLINKHLNRYLDVKTYDKSRVKLSRTVGTDYINANLVTVPKAARCYILTQGPLPDTLGHFWLMIWEQKSNIIVMLNRIVEMEDFVKCEQYWPGSVGSSVDYDDVKLTVTLKSAKDMKHYTVRELLLKDNESEKFRTITQFHYTAWPDHGQPESPTSFLRLLTAIRKTGGLDKMDEPTIVHCSAGIGRSGTFCLIDSILTMVENQGSTEGIDIVNTLIEMRDHRMGLIQSPVQLRFSYMSIICGIKLLERANKLQPHLSSIKDPKPIENEPSNKQTMNGSAQNGKKSRRNKKRQNHSSSNSSSLNIFKKHLLVEALDDIDSDSADSLFYDTVKPRPNIKKPRTSSPNDFNDDYSSRLSLIDNGNTSSPASSASNMDSPQISVDTKAQMLKNAINSLLTENTISTNNVSPNADVSQNTDSVLLRRRERELRNQKINENVIAMKNKMKEEELKRKNYARNMALFKKTAIFGGVTALVLSSLVYIYLHGSNSN